jgi:integrase/recombinase XerD
MYIHMEPENFVKVDEFEALLIAAKDNRERCLLYMMGGIGLRVGELVAARVEHIHYDQSYVYIPKTNAKGKKSRTVALMPQIADALHAYLGDRKSGWIFPSIAGDHIGPRQAQNILNHIAARSGIERRIHPHLLRHSFAVWSLEHGVSVYDLQKQLGHSSILTTVVYLEASPTHMRDSFLRSGMFA